MKVKIKTELDRKRAALDAAKKQLEAYKAEPAQDAAKMKALTDTVNKRREEFRKTEKQKNLIWYGTEVRK